MFQFASYDNGLMPGISDWYTNSAEGGPAVNAYSAALFNAGARRYGRSPASISMMHLVHPSPLRVYACLANNVKYLSYYSFGPYVLGVAGDTWSHKPECYEACGPPDCRAAQIDDLLVPAVLRPSRVAMLWSQATDHWDQRTSFRDKRTTFLGLSHEYYQPDLVSEAQVLSGALEHYDALYVLDAYVVSGVQERIGDWVQAGGLLWASTGALTRNEYNEEEDLLQKLCGLRRTMLRPESPEDKEEEPPVVEPVAGQADFVPHTVVAEGIPESLQSEDARVRARYRDGRPAWLEWSKGKGKVVYVAHRAGETYASRVVRWYPRVWPDVGRSTLTQPLHEARVSRELVVSEPLVMATAQGTGDGTVVMLYNLHVSPRENLQVSLREPARPFSVETFEGLRLKPLPFEFREGQVHVTLPELDGGQMIVVRRRAAPPDDRPERERKRTATQLASEEPLDLAAGAFFAGLNPEWEMAEKLVPLIRHERWEVRRSAAEALGRLRYTASGDALAAAVVEEADSHARGDQMMALARLGHPQASKLCLKLLSDRKMFVKRQAARSALVLLGADPGKEEVDPWDALHAVGDEQRGFASKVAELALQEPDVRVKKFGIRFSFLLEPVRALDEAMAAFAVAPELEPNLRHWARGIAKHDAAFSEWLNRGLPGGARCVLHVGSQRHHPKVAAALIPHVCDVGAYTWRTWHKALVCQGDGPLLREAVKRREDARWLKMLLPSILEHVFEARIGSSLDDWEKWLAERDAEQ